MNLRLVFPCSLGHSQSSLIISTHQTPKGTLMSGPVQRSTSVMLGSPASWSDTRMGPWNEELYHQNQPSKGPAYHKGVPSGITWLMGGTFKDYTTWHIWSVIALFPNSSFELFLVGFFMWAPLKVLLFSPGDLRVAMFPFGKGVILKENESSKHKVFLKGLCQILGLKRKYLGKPFIYIIYI